MILAMKVYILVDDPYKLGNPYISTLVDGILKISEEIEFGYGIGVFWSDAIFTYDAIHVHWPDMILGGVKKDNLEEGLAERLKQIKENGIKIVVTCHNLIPHYSDNHILTALYPLIYNNADVFIHLGHYSYDVMKEKYPKAMHTIIYHHTYDNLYERRARKDCLDHLKLDESKKYILCFGAFRDDEERIIVDDVLKRYKEKGVEVLAPNYYKIGKRRNFILVLIQWLKVKTKVLFTPGLHISGWHVKDEELPYYYGASCISLIQRKKILNSGNLPMGFLMENVVVGPKMGNVGEILLATGNPVFDVDNNESLIDAIEDAFKLVDNNKGLDNRKFAEENYSTSIISQKTIDVYKRIIKRK